MNALQKIFETKHEEVAAAKARIPLAEITEVARDSAPARGFLSALQNAHTDLALIAEVKKASPSKGIIRTDFDAGEIAKTFRHAGAHALSVLTDEKYFLGSPANLMMARMYSGLPCLRKDFLDDPYQVVEARAWGADAVLLIVGALEQSLLCDLHSLAVELGMDVLVEVHTEDEAARALDLKAPLIGINNRNLADFTIDLKTSERILPHIVSRTFAISESGLESRADLDRVRTAGAQGVLIGTTFTSAPDIDEKVREVMGW